jgi:hypothetical protein
MVTTRIAGVTYEGRQTVVSKLLRKEIVMLVREPKNEYDANAIAVTNTLGEQLGYIPREMAARLATPIDKGARISAHVVSVGGYNGRVGVEIALHADNDKALMPIFKENFRQVLQEKTARE